MTWPVWPVKFWWHGSAFSPLIMGVHHLRHLPFAASHTTSTSQSCHSACTHRRADWASLNYTKSTHLVSTCWRTQASLERKPVRRIYSDEDVLAEAAKSNKQARHLKAWFNTRHKQPGVRSILYVLVDQTTIIWPEIVLNQNIFTQSFHVIYNAKVGG